MAPDAQPGHDSGPMVPPPQPGDMAGVLRRNIEALQERRRREEASASLEARIAQAITDFTGSMTFIYLHLAIVAGWIAVNVGLIPWIARFDRTFVILATAASVEAIFLSTFVLISQNRISRAADRRADLDLQIGLLAEHEITRLLELTAEIAARLGVEAAAHPELGELKRDVAPEAVLDELEEREVRT